MTTTTTTTAGSVPSVELITCGVVTTRFLGPTDHRGSRVKATSGSGKTITVGWDHALSITENHAAAAAAIVFKVLGLTADQVTLVGGCLANDDHAFAVMRK